MVLLASTRQRPGMLLNILQSIGQPPTTRNYLIHYISSNNVENPVVERWVYMSVHVYLLHLRSLTYTAVATK